MGRESAFWEPVTAMSTFHSSNLNSRAPIEDTPSTSSSAGWLQLSITCARAPGLSHRSLHHERCSSRTSVLTGVITAGLARVFWTASSTLNCQHWQSQPCSMQVC